MKTKKKVLGLFMAAVMLVSASVLGTMAYLTSTDKVVNTFTVGRVDIKLDEAEVNVDGTKKDNELRVKANQYKLLPGHTYIKDPTVTVLEGSEASYIRIMVTISKASNLKAVFGESFLPEKYVLGWDRATWNPISITENTDKDTITYEFRYKEPVAAPDKDVVLDALFKRFFVPEEVDSVGLEKLSQATVTIVAHAIQAEGFIDADAAWLAFDRPIVIE